MKSYSRFNTGLENRFSEWLILQHYTKGTNYIYRQSVRLLMEFLGDRCATKVTHIDVRKFMLYLAEHRHSILSARRHLQGVRRFYDFLNLGGVVDYVAPRLVSIRPLLRKIPPHFSEKEVGRLIHASETLRDKALIEFFYATGCRLGEGLTLTVPNVDLDARTARVTGKFGKTRIVLLTMSAAEALRAYVGEEKRGTSSARIILPRKADSFCGTANGQRGGKNMDLPAGRCIAARCWVTKPLRAKRHRLR